ncbi:hypothetical protein KTS45_14705 [Halomicroarcula limicola]|uniref:Uncharacterized protein n=1 Tax=Haloarcula limicola TaxID=1429915 RepID=A0A8J7Y663_9EURY|nr:hypothetical protein [Halomicroarcula limicola]MBV0925455.1 hypothetical protein [Halomicroarcula limicola]
MTPDLTDGGPEQTDARSEEMNFSFEWYEEFVRDVDAAGYEFGRYGDPVESGTALLRHDVDLSPERALRMARIEDEQDVHSTYFFLVSSPVYNVLNEDTREVLTAIQDLGHDVGLHFSTHQYWSPEDVPETDEPIAERVAQEWDILSTVADPIETVSFHIPPERVLRHEFDGFPSTYEPRFFSEIGYCGDSSQRWRSDPPEVDRFGSKMQILTHPGLWGEDDDSFEARVREGVAEMRERTSDYAEGRYVLQKFG